MDIKLRAKRFWLTTVLACLLLFLGASVSSAQPPGPTSGLQKGQEALDSLGASLDQFAEKYFWSADELTKTMLEDPYLFLDSEQQLLYIDSFLVHHDEPAERAADNVVEAAPYPDEETFLLHSLPGASKLIYLDFDGHVTSGTSWNSAYNGGQPITSGAFDIDGDPNSFNSTERGRIQGIWQRVAEDYTIYNIDVTTEDPGVEALRRTSGDEYYGIRVLISPTDGWIYDDLGYYIGGIAYIGSFNWSSDTPTFVFSSRLGPNGESSIAEAVSHEVGHTLGLRHDGVINGEAYYEGQGYWAPIMGVGYYKALVQWSKGEYANANNTEDDLALMLNYGASYKSDDHGNWITSASPLPGVNLNGAGIISQRNDVDVFAFQTGAGAITIQANPAPNDPNLNILLQLLDAGGNLVTQANPSGSGGLGATLNLSVSAGTYHILIDGSGEGDPAVDGYSDYASLGQYTISGLVVDPGGNQAPVAVASGLPTSGPATLTVIFDGSASADQDGSIVSYEWNFGDGFSGSGPITSHSYTSPGSYTAVLTVTDDGGFSDTDSVTITVSEPAPAAPTSLGATAVSESQIDLNWSDAADNEDGFSIERKQGAGNFVEIATVGANVTSYSDNGLAADSSYDYRVLAYNGGGYSAPSNIASATTDPPPPIVDQFATGDLPLAGTVLGNYGQTWLDDGVSQQITERLSGGKPATRHDYLEHRWSFDLQPGSAHTFYVSAWRTELGDGDNFVFAYSANGAPFVDMVTITANEDGQESSYFLPASLSGPVTIRVIDTDDTAGNQNLDTVFVDRLMISTVTSPQLLGTISGIVTESELGLPIQNATVTADSGQSTTTGSDGYYSLEVPIGDRSISVAFDGYISQNKPASVMAGTTTPVDFVLDPAQIVEVHLHTLTGASATAPKNRWDATATVTMATIDGLNHLGVAGVTITGNWSGGASGTGECVTLADGSCNVAKSNLKGNVLEVTFTISSISFPEGSYNQAEDHAPLSVTIFQL